MATLNKTASKLDFDKSFHRLNGQPLDANSIFESPKAAKDYASSTTSEAYVGQYIAVKTGGTGTSADPYKYSGYIIADTDGTLKPTTYYEGKNITIDDDGKISATGTLDLSVKLDSEDNFFPVGISEFTTVSGGGYTGDLKTSSEKKTISFKYDNEGNGTINTTNLSATGEIDIGDTKMTTTSIKSTNLEGTNAVKIGNFKLSANENKLSITKS